MKYCGVVTDVSYLDAYSEVEDKENYKYFAHDRIPNRPRIYTDEVPMADLKVYSENRVNNFMLKVRSLYK